MTSLKLVLFLGSVRENRFGIRVADFVAKHLRERKHTVEIFDPLKMDFPLLKKPLHFHKDRSEAPQYLKDAEEIILAADAFVLVSAEYNCTMPPALTNMLDHFAPSSYAYRPSGIVTYSAGQMGGIRAGLAMRPFLQELQTPSIPSTISVPRVSEALKEDGTPNDEKMNERAVRFITQLEWYATALKNQREAFGTP